MTSELISPAQSQVLMLVVAVLLTIVGAGLGFWAKKTPGLVAGLCGPLVFVLWMVHGALAARFGMDSLWLLIGEAVIFIALGAGLGLFWSRLGVQNTEKN